MNREARETALAVWRAMRVDFFAASFVAAGYELDEAVDEAMKLDARLVDTARAPEKPPAEPPVG